MILRTLTAVTLSLTLAACASGTNMERASAPPSERASVPTPTNDGILVIGGTGQLGSYHVNQLSDAGENVIVLARETSSFERIKDADYDVVVADLMDRDAVRAAILEAKPAVIIDTSNVPGIRMDDGDTFYWQSMRTLVDAAADAGVTQIIRHSARGARSSLLQPNEMFLADTRILNYMRDLARAEMALETAAQADEDMTYTIILNRNLPPEPATPTGRGELLEDISIDGGITRSDLARLANTCILNEDCYDQTFSAIDADLPPPDFSGMQRPSEGGN